MNTELLALIESYKNLFHCTSTLGATVIQGSSPEDLRTLAGKLAGIVSRTPRSDPTPLIFLGDVFVAFLKPGRGEFSCYANSANIDRHAFGQVKTVCTRIPHAMRRTSLTWLHHVEAATNSTDHKQISTWLDSAEKHSMNIAQFRNHIREERRIKSQPETPHEGSAGEESTDATTVQFRDEKFTKSMRVLAELRLLTRAVTSNQNHWRSWDADQRKRAAQTVVPFIEFVETMKAALAGTSDVA
jgi:hypothetical protein